MEELDETATLSGVVVNINPETGVFVDVGYERNAILGVPTRYWRKFRRGDILDDLKVQRIDVEKRRFAVTLEDPEKAIEENRTPLQELRVGSEVDGVVDNKTRFGVFVNIGTANCHGRLRVPRAVGQQFVRGQFLRNLVIDLIDIENQKVGLTLEDVDGAVRTMEMITAKALLDAPAPKPKAKTKAKAKPKSKPEEKAEPRQERAAEVKEVKEIKPTAKVAATQAVASLPFQVGELVDGSVTGLSAKGVLVDLGVDKPGMLLVPKELKDEFQVGDRVQGMRVERISAAGVATLSMDDPELEMEPEEAPKAKPAQTKAKGKSRGGART